jgi:hypothetical protein
MHSDDLKRAIKAKAMELELAIELEKPNNMLLQIYKELKELRYCLIQAELTSEVTES